MEVARQPVEQIRDVLADDRVACQQPEVFVQPGSFRMVVASSDVAVPPQDVTRHERPLTVCGGS